MASDALDTARSVLDALQAAVASREARHLVDLFAEPAVLIGAGGDGRDGEGLRRYLTAVASQPESLRWEWREIIPFYEGEGVVAFASFGNIVMSGGAAERRAPIRATVLAVETRYGWRLKHFHGSIPSDF
jgi:uncharacterized protein (TIGR02246 family)